MAGLWADETRAAMGESLRARLAAAAPPGMTVVAVRVLAPNERRLGELIAAAEYSVVIGPERAAQLARDLDGRLAGPLVVSRVLKPSKGKRLKGGAQPPNTTIDVRPRILAASVDAAAGLLRFRIDLSQEPGEGTGVRPREVVEGLCGEAIPDHLVCREQLLARGPDGAGHVGMRSLGPVYNGMAARWQAQVDAQVDAQVVAAG